MRSVTDAQIDAIPGYFLSVDRDVFRVLLEATEIMGGDLAELGAYYGASAVLIGASQQVGEVFTVIDLFEEPAPNTANARESATAYSGLTQQAFEKNYFAVHGRLPVVIRDTSSRIVDRARRGEHRFVHVDASHLFEHVAVDIEAAHTLLKADGIVALDDIRQEHTPGVAAAAWQAVIATNLRPFAITPGKLYATWGDPDPWRRVLLEWARTSAWGYEIQRINDEDVLRLYQPARVASQPHPLKRYVPEVLWPLGARLRRRKRSANLTKAL